MISFLKAALSKDFALRKADPVSMLIWLGIPLVLGGLMSMAFGGSGNSAQAPKALVWLTDDDDSFISQLLVGALDNPEMPLRIELVDSEEAQTKIDSGQGSAAIRIPAGFGQAVLLDTPTALGLTTNPAQQIMPGIVEGLLDALSEAHFYLHQIAGEPLRLMAAGPATGSAFPDAEMISMSLEINALARQLQDRLFPPQIQLNTEALPSAPKSKGMSMGSDLLPGILVMALMFMAQGLSEDLWTERDSGTLARTLSGPINPALLMLSKLISSLIVIGVSMAVCLALAGFVFDLDWLSLSTAWAWATLSGASLFCLFSLITTLATSRRGASLVGNIVLFPLIMLGGSFFPMSAMPEGMAAIGRLTPNGSAVSGLAEILSGEASWSLLTPLLALLACGALCLALTGRRLSHGFASR